MVDDSEITLFELCERQKHLLETRIKVIYTSFVKG